MFHGSNCWRGSLSRHNLGLEKMNLHPHRPHTGDAAPHTRLVSSDAGSCVSAKREGALIPGASDKSAPNFSDLTNECDFRG